MWFNAIIRAKPYQFLNNIYKKYYRCCTTVVSSCREMLGLFLLRASLLSFITYFIIIFFENAFKKQKMINFRKVRTKSSQCGPYELGYTCATMKITISYKIFLLIYKNFPSSDCKLKFVYMKLESLVIANQHVAVNLLFSLVHTARHMQRAAFA
jgi:hypothetical protein